MRTTIELDGKLIAQAMRQTGAKTKSGAVHIALEALIVRASRKPAALAKSKPGKPDYSAVLAMFGSGAIDPDYDPQAAFSHRLTEHQ